MDWGVPWSALWLRFSGPFAFSSSYYFKPAPRGLFQQPSGCFCFVRHPELTIINRIIYLILNIHSTAHELY
nr:MAG TPA: hypothetical protein [Caudoviricetes sp.]